jgi:hypothetical protein
MNPWHLHRLTHHSSDFCDRVVRCGPAFAQSGLFAIPILDEAASQASAHAAAALAATHSAVQQWMRPAVAAPTVLLTPVNAAPADPVPPSSVSFIPALPPV